MVSKTVVILMFVGVCLAIPVEEVRPTVTAAEPGSLVRPGPLAQPGEQIPEGVNPEDIDLKTDATWWYRRGYYPSYPVNRRYYKTYYYQYPPLYSYNTPSYSYWNSYW